MQPVFIIALAIAMGAVADRLAGGNLVARFQAWVAQVTLKLQPPWLGADLRAVADARSTFWAALVLAAALAILGRFTPYGPKLAVLALGFAAWRWDGWVLFGGGIDPKTPAQRLGLFERQLLAVPAFLPPVLVLRGWRPAYALGEVVAMAAFAAFATLLGCVLAALERPGVDVNATIEKVRGAALGGLLAAVLI